MFLLAGGRVVTPAGVLDPGWIRVAGDVIDAVGSGPVSERPEVDLRGQWVLPGFVDLHVHGGGGASFTEGSGDEARKAAAFHRGQGSTSLLASLVTAPLAERSEFTFLALGWAVAVADEAALKLREASRTWAESYPAMEYRHGPISVSDENTAVWALGQVPPSLLADARQTGAMIVASDADPLVGLTGAQRLAAELAERKGIDPDQPRALSRSVILA